MKTLHNIFSGLLDVFAYNKKLFILMLIGIISSDLILIYCYGYFTSYKNSTLEGIAARTYTGYNDMYEYSLDEIADLDFENENITTYSVSKYFRVPNDTETVNGIILTDTEGNERILAGTDHFGRRELAVKAFGNDQTKGVLEASFGKTEFSDEPYEVILPYNENTKALQYDSETDSYGTLSLGGKKYEVIGVSTDTTAFTIPIDAFDELGYKADYVHYYTDTVLPHKESRALADKIFVKYGCEGMGISYPYSYYESAQRDYRAWVVIIFLGYIISMLAFLFYMQYFMGRCRRSYVISHICGASKKRLVIGIILQNAALSVICLAAALLLNLTIGSMIDLVGSVVYTVEDTFNMLITVIAATVILTIPSVVKITKLSAAELYREAA